MLQDQLRRVARAMEQEPNYNSARGRVWRVLAEQVDQEHFERTGQILTPALSTEDIAADTNGTEEPLTPEEAEKALQELIDGGHIAPARRPGNQPSYRLILPQATHEGTDARRD